MLDHHWHLYLQSDHYWFLYPQSGHHEPPYTPQSVVIPDLSISSLYPRSDHQWPVSILISLSQLTLRSSLTSTFRSLHHRRLFSLINSPFNPFVSPSKPFFRSSLNSRTVFTDLSIFPFFLTSDISFSVVFTSSPLSHRGYVWALPVISLLLTNNVSPVRAWLSIWWERFRGTQKEDDRGTLSI